MLFASVTCVTLSNIMLDWGQIATRRLRNSIHITKMNIGLAAMPPST